MSESNPWKKGPVAKIKYKEDENLLISEIYVWCRIM